VAGRDEIVSFLDDLLSAGEWEDHGPNGLQVPGSDDVRLVVSGVSAHAELFAQAAAAGAQMVLVHHGLFWNGQPLALTPRLRDRLKLLFHADQSLVAHHLPLDAHPEHGNNALICAALGLERAEPFGTHRGRTVGFVGRSAEGVVVADLVERCSRAFAREPLVLGRGPATVRSVGIVSGGAASSLGEAIALGLDAFLTGEPSEPGMADAEEGGIHFLACGHYATETLGVRRLGNLVAERFGIEHRFIEVRNPV